MTNVKARARRAVLTKRYGVENLSATLKELRLLAARLRMDLDVLEAMCVALESRNHRKKKTCAAHAAVQAEVQEVETLIRHLIS